MTSQGLADWSSHRDLDTSEGMHVTLFLSFLIPALLKAPLIPDINIISVAHHRILSDYLNALVSETCVAI